MTPIKSVCVFLNLKLVFIISDLGEDAQFPLPARHYLTQFPCATHKELTHMSHTKFERGELDRS